MGWRGSFYKTHTKIRVKFWFRDGTFIKHKVWVTDDELVTVWDAVKDALKDKDYEGCLTLGGLTIRMSDLVAAHIDTKIVSIYE